MMRLGHCLWLVLCISFSTFTQMVGWQEGHLSCKQGFLPWYTNAQVEEEQPSPRGNQLTQTYLKNGC